MNRLRSAKRWVAGTIAAAAGILLLAAVAIAQSNASLEVQLKAAMNKELVDGDLEGAIELYKQIAASPNGQRPVVAKALLQMGLCYEKLGNDEAQKAYEQVLSKYADQTEIASQARERLAAICL